MEVKLRNMNTLDLYGRENKVTLLNKTAHQLLSPLVFMYRSLQPTFLATNRKKASFLIHFSSQLLIYIQNPN